MIKIPTHAILFQKRRVQVLTYDGNGFFTVLDRGDRRVFVHRDHLTFLPRAKKSSKKVDSLP